MVDGTKKKDQSFVFFRVGRTHLKYSLFKYLFIVIQTFAPSVVEPRLDFPKSQLSTLLTLKVKMHQRIVISFHLGDDN